MRLKLALVNIAFVLLLLGCSRSNDVQRQEVKNLILLIGDGASLMNISSGLDSTTNSYNINKFQVHGKIGSIDKSLSDISINDDVTMLSIGKNSNYKTLGLDIEGNAHPNLLELAAFKGMSTGVVTVSSLINAIPASFIVHAVDRNQYESIAAEFLNSPIDLFIGGGRNYFNDRSDGADLVQRLKNKGFLVYQEIDHAIPSSKLVVLLDENKNQSDKFNENPILQKYSNLALQSLSLSQRGFFLVIDGNRSETNPLCQSNDSKSEKLDFDQSIGLALDFADKNPGTLVIVAANFNHNDIQKDIQTSIAKGENKSLISIYAYGAMANIFNGTYDNAETFNKIVGLLKLDVE